MPLFSEIDYAALTWFAVAWFGFNWLTEASPWARHSVSRRMDRFRREWIVQMLERDLRMVDTQILGNLVNGIAFFASTSLLAVGGLFALLGAPEQMTRALQSLPGAVVRHDYWELKIVLLLLIFVLAFYHFAWAFRLSNYTSILVGATPRAPVQSVETEAWTDRVATVHSRAGFHFNRGLRAFMFAPAVLGWFVHAGAFVGLTGLVVAIQIRREFFSTTVKALRAGGATTVPPAA